MNNPDAKSNELLTSSQLRALEAESIHIIREVVAEFQKPGLLFSGGKDSIVMLHLAVKALRPAKLPFPIVHIDTGHNFPEAIEYRDRTAENLGIDLIVGSVQEALDSGGVQASTLPAASRNRLQTPVLLKTISNGKFDAVFGGARRDEERARAKNVCTRSRTNSDSGIPRTNVLNYGICTTVSRTQANISVCSLFPTGPNSISGSTFSKRTSNFLRSTSLTNEKCSNETAC